MRDWQGDVFDLVAARGATERSTARLASFGVNGAGPAVMVAVFAQTGGLTGAEVAVAGGTSAVGQRVLEAIFGDPAVRSLAARAREDLLQRAAPCCARSRHASRAARPAAPGARRGARACADACAAIESRR